MIVWPATLPAFVRREDFQLEAFRPRISFEPDEGLPIERLNGTVAIDELDCSVYLKTQPTDQVQIFRDFVENDLTGGLLQFTFRHPVTGDDCQALITGDRPYRLRPVSGVEYIATFQIRVTNL